MNYNEINELFITDNDYMYENAIIVFDTSSLLDLYSYSSETAYEILDKCAYYFNKRLFLPNYVKFEYDKNRQRIIEKQIDEYSRVFSSKDNNGYFMKIMAQKDEIIKIKRDLKNYMNNFEQHFGNTESHPYFSESFIFLFKAEVENVINDLKVLENKSVFKEFTEKLKIEQQTQIEEIKKQIEQDHLLDRIESFFEIGLAYKYPEILKIVAEGKVRYEAQIPPGYQDMNDKIGFEQYGDLIIWKQIIDYAKREDRPVIFVSNDIKEDWNEIQENQEKNKKNKKTDSRKPRYELLIEFNEIVNNEFKKITLIDFIYEFNNQLEEKIGYSAMEEIKLRDIEKLIANEADEFIRSIETSIENFIDGDFEPPSEAVEWDIIENWSSFESIDEIEVSIVGDNKISVEYLVTFQDYRQITFYEYWGRDDDTRDIITSPGSSLSVEGEVVIKITIQMSLEYKDDFFPAVHHKFDPDFEVFEDNRNYSKSSWEELIDYWEE